MPPPPRLLPHLPPPVSAASQRLAPSQMPMPVSQCRHPQALPPCCPRLAGRRHWTSLNCTTTPCTETGRRCRPAVSTASSVGTRVGYACIAMQGCGRTSSDPTGARPTNWQVDLLGMLRPVPPAPARTRPGASRPVPCTGPAGQAAQRSH